MGALQAKPKPDPSPEVQRAVLDLDLSLASVARRIRDGRIKNIVVLAGAGISVAAGIPDFRSPGTGLYDRIREEKWPLPQPESLFDLEFFRSNPKPFYARAGSMAPGRYLPTKTHYFFKLLESKGKLLRVYTQNVDTLERITELSDDVLMEAHGSFHTAGCVECHKEYPQEWILSFLHRADAARREGGAADDADVEVPLCEVCGSPVKPGIVFFGEALPSRFFSLSDADMTRADLLLVLGTSLEVYPVAGLLTRVPVECPRVLFNREAVAVDRRPAGEEDASQRMIDHAVASVEKGHATEEAVEEALEETVGHPGGFRFGRADNYRDVFVQGDCDDGVARLARALGWGKELNALVRRGHAALRRARGEEVEEEEEEEGEDEEEEEEEEEQVAAAVVAAKDAKPEGGGAGAASRTKSTATTRTTKTTASASPSLRLAKEGGAAASAGGGGRSKAGGTGSPASSSSPSSSTAQSAASRIAAHRTVGGAPTAAARSARPTEVTPPRAPGTKGAMGRGSPSSSSSSSTVSSSSPSSSAGSRTPPRTSGAPSPGSATATATATASSSASSPSTSKTSTRGTPPRSTAIVTTRKPGSLSSSTSSTSSSSSSPASGSGSGAGEVKLVMDWVLQGTGGRDPLLRPPSHVLGEEELYRGTLEEARAGAPTAEAQAWAEDRLRAAGLDLVEDALRDLEDSPAGAEASARVPSRIGVERTGRIPVSGPARGGVGAGSALAMRTLIAALALAAASAAPTVAPSALYEYVHKPDSVYGWFDTGVRLNQNGSGWTGYVLNMTSQAWQTPADSSAPIWTHQLVVVVPDVIRFPNFAAIYNTGGGNQNPGVPSEYDEDILLCAALANSTGTLCATLYQVPNECIIFPNDPAGPNKCRSEDAAVAFTWWRYLQNPSGDPTGILEFPMAKSVSRAMDTVTAWASKNVGTKPSKYLITGASKRGWTTWLTGATDERVVAIAPIVMDLLNFRKGVLHMYQAYGGFTFAFQDYCDMNITDYFTEPVLDDLSQYIDPLMYAANLTMPKLVIDGTGDEFFMPDDDYYWWGMLQGPTYRLMIPNAEHSMATGALPLILGLEAFWAAILTNSTMPQVNWSIAPTTGVITATTNVKPSMAVLTQAQTLDGKRRDFRLVRGNTPADPCAGQGIPVNIFGDACVVPILWFPEQVNATSVDAQGYHYTFQSEAPAVGWKGFLGEFYFPGPMGTTYHFTTQVSIIPQTFPYPPCNPCGCTLV